MNNNENLLAFIADVCSELTERNEEAQKERAEHPSDMFNSGRALAYQEIVEIINNRLDIYEITTNEVKRTV